MHGGSYSLASSVGGDLHSTIINPALRRYQRVIMETSIQRALNDKLYDKRKVGALEYVHGTVFGVVLPPSR